MSDNDDFKETPRQLWGIDLAHKQDAAAQKQEVVQIPLWEREQHSDTVALHTPSICLEMQGIRIEIHEQAGADVIRNTLLALRQLC